MAEKKVSAMNADTSPTIDDVMMTVDQTSGKNKKVTLSDLIALIGNNITPASWTADLVTTYTTSTGYNNGNRSVTLSTSSNVSGYLSKGMRFWAQRSTTAPTQCADLEASSSQYATRASASVSGITFTDNFTCEAWIKLESHGSIMMIVSKTSGPNGWQFYINADGTLRLAGLSTTQDYVTSYQSIPLNRWVHVAASLDMSGTSGVIYMDGVLVPSSYTDGATSSLTQAGNLELGSQNGGSNYFDGEISDVRLWSDIRTETEIQDNMYKQLTGSESNLIGYWKLDGDFEDSTANGNDLTEQNGAAATTADNPFSDDIFGIVTDVTSSTVTLQTPIGYGVPLDTITDVYYSSQSAPYGFPKDRELWDLQLISLANYSTTSTSWGSSNLQLSVPQGGWTIGWDATLYSQRASTTFTDSFFSLSESTSSVSNEALETRIYSSGATGTITLFSNAHRSYEYTLSVMTPFYLIYKVSGSSMTARFSGDSGATVIYARFIYL